MRYKVNRIGFVNFWLYDEEDFYFYDGKLLLRGTNGSGKTVTMQSFFPLIFDGNKSPERLDPFGSRDRKIEDYLLPEGFPGNENTGYLYMEFFNKEENKYLTIGIGLRAIKNRNCEFWGFSITDNRRIGTDLLLFKERNLRIPLTKKELQARIGTGGTFVENTKLYKKMVNDLLFGFPNLDLYSEFINLLIQVRSPKLSNSTRPTQLTKILSTVLEPLSEDDLRVMADSIEDMNKYKEKLNDLEIEQKACNSLKNSYLDYNKSVLYQKGENYLKYKKQETDISKEIKEKEKRLTEITSEIELETSNILKLNQELLELEHRKSKLEETDLKSISQELEEIISKIKKLEDEKTKKEDEKDQKESILFQNEKDLKVKEDNLFEIEKSFDELLSYLTDLEIGFSDFNYYLEELTKEKFDFKEISTYQNLVRKHINILTTLKDIAFKISLKEAELNNLKNKYEEASDKLKELQTKRIEISNFLLDETNSLKEEFAKTSSSNKVLKLEQNELDTIYQTVDTLERDMFIKIKDILKEIVYKYKDKINLEITSYNNKILEYKDKIKNLKLDLENVNNKLLEHLDDFDTINYFKDNKIDYKYLYELIEFKKEIPDTKRKQIESFLLETGVLTSFVTLEDIDTIDVKTRCLKPGNYVKNNLLKYLEVLNTPYKEKIENVLKSISLDECSYVHVLDDGKYEFALIKGNVNNNHELRYIGEFVRDLYIKREKEKIEISIKKYEEEIINLENLILKLNQNINTLDMEYNNFNFKGNIEDLFKQLDKVDFDILNINNSLEEQVRVISNIDNEVRELKTNLEDAKKGYTGSFLYQDILESLKNSTKSLELINEITSVLGNFSNTLELVNHYKININNLNDDLDNINYKINDILYELTSLKGKQNTLNDLLNSDKYKDVGVEYKKITDRLIELKEEIPSKRELIATNKKDLEYLSKDIEVLTSKKEEINTFKEVTYKIFIDEYKLNYVTKEEFIENELSSFLKEIKPNSTSREIYEKFNDSMNKHAQVLINYAPKNITLHEKYEILKLDYMKNDNKEEIMNLFDDAKRRDLSFNYLGKNVNLIDLSSSIDSSISSYLNLISEENRRLFEDLLINNIGSSIRNKIYQSEEWIQEVKEYMESMNTSSGLSFSLKWSGIEAMNEDELDTKEIVKIFKKDASSLKQEHLTKITNHFKSKIKMREEVLEESERNYLEIIKDVLDYRKWFEFKLYFKRGSSDFKELTDREFNKMSGGEKAIAMYIPLFSSIFAKLNSAFETAPHVIALDEAFAGVDDENIKDAFRILSKLDLDYVLTSQQLWGDYETVKHLAISELHHPPGSNVVSVLKYKWDGTERMRVDDESDYKE